MRHFALLLAALLFIGAVGFQGFYNGNKLYLFKDVGNDAGELFYPEWVQAETYPEVSGTNQANGYDFRQGLGNRIFTGHVWLPHPIKILEKNVLTASLLGPDYLVKRQFWLAMAHFFSIGLLFYLLLRLQPSSGISAVIGAISLAFSGYMLISSTWYTDTRLVLHALLWLLGIEGLRQQRWWGGVVLFLGAFYTGLSLQFWLFGIFSLIYLLYRQIATANKQAWRRCLWVFPIVFTAILTNLPENAYRVARIFNSPRMASINNEINWFPDFFTLLARWLHADSLGIGNDFSGWNNYYEAPVFYAGAWVLLILISGLGSLPKLQRRAGFFLLSFWGLLIVFQPLRHAFLLFSGDYWRQGFSGLVVISCLLVATNILQFPEKIKRQNLIIATLALAAMLIILAVYNSKFSLTALLTVLATAGYTLSILFVNKFKPAWAYLFLLLILVCEMSFFVRNNMQFRSEQSYQLSANPRENYKTALGYFDGSAEAIKKIKQADTTDFFFRTEKTYRSGPITGLNDALVQNYCGTAAYSSFNSKGQTQLLQVLGLLPDNKHQSRVKTNANRWLPNLSKYPEIMGLLGVKYVLSNIYADTLPNKYNQHLHPIQTFYIHANKGFTVYKNDYYKPMGFVYDTWMPLDTFTSLPDDAVKRELLTTTAIINPENNAFLTITQADKDYNLRQNSKNDDTIKSLISVNFTSVNFNRFEGNLSLPTAGVLCWAIPFDPAWKLYLNGQLYPLCIINMGLMGAPVSRPGNYSVEMVFEPEKSWAEVINNWAMASRLR